MSLQIEQRRSRRTQRKQHKQHKRRTETEQQREERLEKGRAERRQLRQRLIEDDDAVLTFKEWCALCSHSERQGRRIIKGGNGPTVTMLSDKRIGIESAAATIGAGKKRGRGREWPAEKLRAPGAV